MIIFLLKLHVELFENVFQFHIQNLNHVLVYTLCDIKKGDMESIFEFINPLIVCIS